MRKNLFLAFICPLPLIVGTSKLAWRIYADQLDAVFVIPQIQGNDLKLDRIILDMIYRVEYLSTEISNPRIAIVQVGELGHEVNEHSIRCLKRFMSLETVKYKLYGVLGGFERGLLNRTVRFSQMDLQVSNFVKNTYRELIMIEGRWPRSPVADPEGRNILIVNAASARSIPGASWIESRSDAEACQTGLTVLLSRLQVDRVITVGETFSSRCGSRLLTLGSTYPSFLEIRFDPFHVSLNGFEERKIWPLSHEYVLPKAEHDWSDFDHVLVIPDIHGDYEAFVDALFLGYMATSGTLSRKDFKNTVERNEIIESGRVLLVQLGDLIDRGPFTSACMTLLARVERILGWRVVRLFGNHELMNFHRTAEPYVHPHDDLNLDKRSLEFSLDGDTWKRMTQSYLIAAAVRGPSLGSRWMFVHGGISKKWFSKFGPMIQSLRSRGSSRIGALNEFSAHAFKTAAGLSLAFEDEDSPLWTRMYENMSEEKLCNEYLSDILSVFEVDRIMVGHMPQMRERKPKSRCNGRIWLADVGISQWMTKGRKSYPTAYKLSADGTATLLQFNQTILPS